MSLAALLRARPGVPGRRVVVPLIGLFLLVASWGPTADTVSKTVPASAPTPNVAVPEPLAEPAPVPRPRPVLAPSVIVHDPDVLVQPSSLEDPSEVLSTFLARDDVEYVTGARRFEATLPSAAGPLGAREETVGADEPLTVIAVNPVSFRPLTPDVTAQSLPVWEKLLDGHAIVRHEVAFQRGIALGDVIRVRTEDGERAYRVGALASNGVPPLADVVVPLEGIEDVSDPGWNVVIVAASEGTGPVWLGEQLVRAAGGGSFERLDESGRSGVPGWGALETFTYVDTEGGGVQILGDWVSRFIVTVDLPIVGRTRCNRLMVPQLQAAMGEIVARGLAHLVDPSQFGGCWVPRHIDWDPAKAISMHAWGLAVDLNVAGNQLGHAPTMDMRLVEIFQRWGFYWGGWWDRPDGMHFQVNQFVAVD